MKLGEIFGVLLMVMGGMLALIGPCAFAEHRNEVNVIYAHPFFCGLGFIFLGILVVSYFDEIEAKPDRDKYFGKNSSSDETGNDDTSNWQE